MKFGRTNRWTGVAITFVLTLLVIPAFNEAATIKDLVTAAKAQIPNVLVIDDGSFDATADAAGDVMVCRHDRNRGKGEALKTGFKYALEHRNDYVITIDADGQHDPEDLAAFLPLLGEYDLILGNRMGERARVPILRRLANQLASFIERNIDEKVERHFAFKPPDLVVRVQLTG